MMRGDCDQVGFGAGSVDDAGGVCVVGGGCDRDDDEEAEGFLMFARKQDGPGWAGG